MGTIPRDSQLVEAVREQMPVVDYAPDSPASRSLRLIAKQLDTAVVAQTDTSSPEAAGISFWNSFAEAEA
ncbi:MAG: hypothetical protein WKF84_28685 [Pyrinomonadaceae bacterium]